jgi:hypothetical protein
MLLLLDTEPEEYGCAFTANVDKDNEIKLSDNTKLSAITENKNTNMLFL